MKKTVGLLLMGLSAAGAVNATTLTFDDISITDGSNYQLLSDSSDSSYGGFSWDANWGLGNTSELFYSDASYSGTQYLSNYADSNDLTVSSTEAFDFEGAWFTTPTEASSKSYIFDLASNITITAYDSASNLIGSTTAAIDYTSSTWIAANFADVSTLVFTATGDSDGDTTGYFTMDDFTFSRSGESGGGSTPVPIPAPILLFGAGIAGLGLMTRNKKLA